MACAARPAAERPGALSAANAADATLTARLEDIARPSHGKIGVAYRVLETGRAYELRGSDSFPMASVYKFPIALTVLAQVDGTRLHLADEIAVTKDDLSIDRSPIAQNFPESGRTLTVGELARDMIIDSDNTACDVLLKKIGGPSVVMSHLGELGIRGLRVDRDEITIDADSLRAARPGALAHVDRASLAALEDSLTPAEQNAMQRAYMNDPRDTSTPIALVELLSRFQTEQTLTHDSTAFLRTLMENARPARLGLKLPQNTPLLHKTGTGWGSANDVGIITLPNGQHVAVAVLLTQARGLSLEAYDALIADAGRAVYDSVTR